MDDDFRLQVDLESDGIGGRVADHLRAAGLEHDLDSDFGERVIVSHDGARIFLYAGNREQLDRARGVIERFLSENGGVASFELRRWHPAGEDWEDPDKPLPATGDEKAAEREQLMETEDAETAAQGGLAQFEVRVEFPSHGEARELAEKLKDEGLEPVRRWRYLVVGAADEDSADELAERIRAEAPADSKVTVEGSLGYVVRKEQPTNPFFFLGGLAG
jgi:hypothetical protein